MKSSFRKQRRLPTSLIASLTLMLGAVGILSSSGNSCAQQGPDRQLVQAGGSTNTNAGTRIALVIGNGAYTSAPPLKNPPNDARDMAATLKGLGFDVATGINVSQRDMKRLIREFGMKLKGGGSGLFYYAGHGVQSKGRNYLIPVDAVIQSEAEVEDSGVDAALILNFMDEAQNGLNIVILDACRNNPFARSFRSANDGLAQVDAPTGTLIAYATAPGRVASDGTEQNGLYTSALLKQMRIPGLSVTDMFMRVRAEVMKQTGSKQVPWEASSLVGSFFFVGNSANPGLAGSAPNEPAAVKIEQSAFELSYWDTIKTSTDANDFKSYLEKYPSGQFVTLAKNRIASIEAATKSVESRSSSSNSATELAFWDSIKNSTSADDYRAYLEKYPNGEFVELAKVRLRPLEAAVAEKEKKDQETFKGGYGVNSVGENAPGAFTISSSELVFKFDHGYQIIKDCHQFVKANVKGSSIYEIEETKSHLKYWRFDAASPADAVRTLEAITSVCTKSGSLVATTSKTFKIDWGFRGAGVDLFFNGNLLISDNKFQLEVDQIEWQRFSKDPQEGQRSADHYRVASQHMDCRAFKLARVDDFWIREIKYDSMSYRLRFRSAVEAVDALAEIQRICKANL